MAERHGGSHSQNPNGAEVPAQSSPPRLLVNVADLRRRLGQRRVEPIEVLLARQVVVTSSTTEAPVEGQVVVESIERGVSVFGEVAFAWQGECRRCLEPTTGSSTVEIAEIYQVGAPADSDLLPLDVDQIDLVPLVREAVVLSLPLAPLCRSDCPGPDPDRYPALMADEIVPRDDDGDAAESGERDGDPRWAALDQLRLDN